MLYPVTSSEETGVRVQEKVREFVEEFTTTNSSTEAECINMENSQSPYLYIPCIFSQTESSDGLLLDTVHV